MSLSSCVNIFRAKLAMFFVYSYICNDKTTNMKRLLTIILLLVCTTLMAAEPPQRSYYSLNEDWRFSFVSSAQTNVSSVTLPHTWNDGVGECVLSTAKYYRQLKLPRTLRGKRLFLRFGGVSNEANVFINGRYVGEHRGAHTAFTFEITDKVRLGEINNITVLVSNTPDTDILPISSDFDSYGGIYRDVELIVTNRNIISPTFYSSSGVLVEQHEVSEERASGVVKVYLSPMDEGAHLVTVRFVAEDGYEVCRYSAKAGKADVQQAVELPFSIDYPELWSPESRRMYRVEVLVGNVDNPSDVVVVNTGFRSVSINDDNRLCINGEAVDIRGVNLAHDRLSRGVVSSAEEMRSDLCDIEAMGANALRSVVGPHPEELYQMCDRSGMLVWVDTPFVRNSALFSDVCYYPTESFKSNATQQLKEIIYQNYNHPSVVMWGLFSLVSKQGDDVIPFINTLNDLAHSIDRSRLTVGCSNTDGDINFITDLIVLRQNVGWQQGSYDDIRVWSRQLKENKRFRKLRSGVCYGEEGCADHIVDEVQRIERGAWFRPERTSCAMHESYSALIAEAGIFWGVWLDNMYDYASMYRPEGMCYSGMICFDHATRKDAYYLYRALWNREKPTIYISDRRWTSRCGELHSIKVYSSAEHPMLIVEGDSIELREVSPSVYRADSVRIGERTLIRAVDASGLYRDSLLLRADPLRVAR